MPDPFIEDDGITCSIKEHGSDQFVLEVSPQQACPGSLGGSTVANDFSPSGCSGIRTIGVWSESCFVYINQIKQALFKPAFAFDEMSGLFRMKQAFCVWKCFFFALSPYA